MHAVLERRDSLVVLPTGGGKSLCFQAPALIDTRGSADAAHDTHAVRSAGLQAGPDNEASLWDDMPDAMLTAPPGVDRKSTRLNSSH